MTWCPLQRPSAIGTVVEPVPRHTPSPAGLQLPAMLVVCSHHFSSQTAEAITLAALEPTQCRRSCAVYYAGRRWRCTYPAKETQSPREKESMRCPTCGGDTEVLATRSCQEGFMLRRRRQCLNPKCGERFSTHEIAKYWPKHPWSGKKAGKL